MRVCVPKGRSIGSTVIADRSERLNRCQRVIQGSIVPPGRGAFPIFPGASCQATIKLSLRDKEA